MKYRMMQYRKSNMRLNNADRVESIAKWRDHFIAMGHTRKVSIAMAKLEVKRFADQSTK